MRGLLDLNPRPEMFAKLTRIYGIALQGPLSGPTAFRGGAHIEVNVCPLEFLHFFMPSPINLLKFLAAAAPRMSSGKT
jgi:hypothetical protein